VLCQLKIDGCHAHACRGHVVGFIGESHAHGKRKHGTLSLKSCLKEHLALLSRRLKPVALKSPTSVLGQLKETGLGVLLYVNAQRCCAKELVMRPRQTCPEHRHPNIGDSPGKEATFPDVAVFSLPQAAPAREKQF
jgi:hypothetical protein